MNSIFPENDWEEKEVNQLARATPAAIAPKAARATISLRRHAAIPFEPGAGPDTAGVFHIAENVGSRYAG
jgi:hypothetical protein